MTTARQLITLAAQLVAESSEGQIPPSPYFANKVALPRLNGMIRALFGRLIGADLVGLRPSSSQQVQSGARYFVGSVGLTLTLPEIAVDGDYFGVSDVNAALASRTVTVARNGWLLEGLASDLTLSTSGATREWFFRADLGNWQPVVDLGLDDTVYFPADIVHVMAPMLAAELLPVGYDINPVLAPQSNAAREKIAQRYAARLRANVDPGIRAIDGFRSGYNITLDR